MPLFRPAQPSNPECRLKMQRLRALAASASHSSVTKPDVAALEQHSVQRSLTSRAEQAPERQPGKKLLRSAYFASVHSQT